MIWNPLERYSAAAHRGFHGDLAIYFRALLQSPYIKMARLALMIQPRPFMATSKARIDGGTVAKYLRFI